MIDEIADKIVQLKTLDPHFTVFGSDSHRYKSQKEISEDQIAAFESKHKIILPSDYRNFILRFGDGFCGPAFGLFKLENGIYDLPTNIENSETITLNKPFRLNGYWNLEEFPKDDEEKWDDEYFDIKWTDGMLRICHLGCAIYVNLIITGKERGNIWIDDRSSDAGIYPVNHYSDMKKYDFLSWYLGWLDYSLNQLNN